MVAPIMERLIPFAAVFGNYNSEGTHRIACKNGDINNNNFNLFIIFLHISFPEFGDPNFIIRNGYKRKPSENPNRNIYFYNVLVTEGI
ncbi:hypothetical protein PoMZ_09259 [Pyricularia oryzae]|uniref:Uncharacterized protein n=1 Tax=Pyricularia oryzae TaxID=318829 RepID=A0A4P7MWH9_PYROR|nr:hypothetical protein PoMZ_09259 [Pyricularia oryzae]